MARARTKGYSDIVDLLAANGAVIGDDGDDGDDEDDDDWDKDEDEDEDQDEDGEAAAAAVAAANLYDSAHHMHTLHPCACIHLISRLLNF